MQSYFHFEQNNNPYYTLALEEYLLNNITTGQIILLLYIHDNAVIIGRNQNVFLEVDIEKVQSSCGMIARRISGGGAVYHDKNNLNFSFIASNDIYDVNRQMKVILNAVKLSGFDAYTSGRNDILIDGRKFSGNAFCKKQNTSFHHGTILIDTDIEKITQYLKPPNDKLKLKGVKSVASRVINLCEIKKTDTETVAKNLKTAFENEYGSAIKISNINETEVEKIKSRNQSNDWIFNKNRECEIKVRDRFDWGGIDIGINLLGEYISYVQVDTDSLLTEFPKQIEDNLNGKKFCLTEISSALKKINADDIIISDILGLFL